jgi:hypothetical protein
MAITLTTLRARVRDQVENAWGFPDPLPVIASAETLSTLRDRIETHLQDATNARWATTDVDEAIEKALEEYNRHSPALKLATLTLAATGREVDISSLTTLLRVIKVWYPYDSTDPSWPPNWVQFEVYPGALLHIDSPDEPASGEKVRIWYTAPATISGLNAATATTIPEDDMTYLINGAVYYACHMRAIEIAEDLAVDDDVNKRILEVGEEQGKAFRYGIRKREPAWQRYAYGFRNDDIDEAIRWALGRFNEIAPQETIGTLTVSTAGREQSLATLTGLLRVTRVWYPYDSADPAYPPNWVPYEQWGSTLFIKTGSEPAAADVIRVWYEKLCTINGLDSATSTTLPDDAETLILGGAVGYVLEERILEEPQSRWRVPRAFREWAAQRLKDFDRGLRQHAKRQAAGNAGLHELPTMDRWDKNDDSQW